MSAAGNVMLDPPCGPGWWAVGDAAAAHDPLAGDGVVRALDGGIAVAALIAAAAPGGGDTLDDHARQVTGRFERHLERSRAFHAREDRWPASAYWARRTGGTATAGPRRLTRARPHRPPPKE